MSNIVTVRLPKELASWLRATARRRGVPQSSIVRDHLEKARAASPDQAFMTLAGCVEGPKNLSQRKGFRRP
ncbi:MAG: ribbon-helix-helix protein, CopG family [Nevskia sp.]|nr:ribbon-helix-helix protein, CopG family [Nevskia sp.]